MIDGSFPKPLYRHRCSCGNSITEYTVIGMIVLGVAIITLGMTGRTFQGTLAGLKQEMLTSRDAAIREKTSVLASKQTDRLNALSQRLSMTEKELLQQNVPAKIQTAGANGTTLVLAKQLALLSDQLLQNGKITQEQSNLLMKLSNQGHRIAQLEGMLEQAFLRANGDPEVFKNAMFVVDGKEVSTTELTYWVGFLNDIPFTSVSLSPENAEPEMRQFLLLYQQVLDSGIATDPLVRSTLESAVFQIAEIGGGVEHGIWSVTAGGEKFPKDPKTFNGQLASIVTNIDSSKVCRAGNFESDGIQCKP